jgi:hypothetical protein
MARPRKKLFRSFERVNKKESPQASLQTFKNSHSSMRLRHQRQSRSSNTMRAFAATKRPRLALVKLSCAPLLKSGSFRAICASTYSNWQVVEHSHALQAGIGMRTWHGCVLSQIHART